MAGSLPPSPPSEPATKRNTYIIFSVSLKSPKKNNGGGKYRKNDNFFLKRLFSLDQAYNLKLGNVLN